MSFEDEFGGFEDVPEEVDGERERYDGGLDQAYVEERESLVRVLAVQEAWLDERTDHIWEDDVALDDVYEAAADAVAALGYTEQTIRDYCRWDERDGLFLSALINEHDAEEYVLPDLSIPTKQGYRDGLEYVGFQNESRVTVEGAVGDHAGAAMHGGVLRIEGHAGDDVGHAMTGGELHVHGNAGGFDPGAVGRGMEDGTLVVHGKVYGEAGPGMGGGLLAVGGEVTDGVGRDMAGGTVELHGDAFLASDRDGGEIYRVRSGERRRVWPIPDLGVPHQEEVELLWATCRAWRQEGNGYQDAVEAVQGLSYGRDAIYTFAEQAVMQEYDGHFVSALINEHDGAWYRLPDMTGVTFVGSFTADEIVVEGGVGGFAGGEMRGGDLTIQGDAENQVGYAMHGGSITVEGDVAECCGERMTDGHIEVHGDAGEETGVEMDDGRIRVHGAIDGFEPYTWDGVIEQERDGAWVEVSEGYPEGYDADP